MKIVPISIIIPYKKFDDHYKVWMQKRLTSDEFEGKLEFPGGKIETGEQPAIAGVREISEEVGIDLVEGDLNFYRIFNSYLEDKTIMLCIFLYHDIDNRFARDGWYEIGTEEALLKIEPYLINENIKFVKNLSKVLK